MSLDQASRAFLDGYGMAARLATPAGVPGLLGSLGGLPPGIRPFAFEGAGMALRGRERRGASGGWLDRCLREAPEVWRLFIRLGEGCARARMGLSPGEDPEVQDGYGFQTALTGGPASARARLAAPRARRGLGRGVWFLCGGDADAAAAIVSRIPGRAQAWSGVGVACVFAGDPRAAASRLPELAGEHRADLLRGAAEALHLWTALPGPTPGRVAHTAGVLGVEGGAAGPAGGLPSRG